MQQTVLQKASAFIAGQRFETVDPLALHLGKRALVDYLGCAVAGQKQPVMEALRRYFQHDGNAGKASVFGFAGTRRRENAAMINATAGHALDFDDTSWTTIGHPTTVAAPVALAEAEHLGLTGRHVLAGYCIGVETAHTLARITMPEVSQRGWHTTSVYGVLMAAAVSAWMRGLDRDTVCNALGIAMSRAGGVRSNFGTMTKPLHAGLAALAGMECVSLAEAGITASPAAFEAADGFAACFAASESVQAATFGDPWDLVKNGLAFKMYPCCSGAHPALDIVSGMMREGVLRADTIQTIHAGLSLLGPRELVNHHPATPLEARFSLEFALAALLLRGELTLDQFAPETVLSPDIQDFMARVTMDVDEELTKLGFIGTAPVKLTITLKDGRTLNASNDLARGNPAKPVTDEELSRKFTMNVSRYLSGKAADNLLHAFFTLEQQTDVHSLMAMACNAA